MDIAKRQELINKLFNKACKFDIDALNLLNSYSLLYFNSLFLFNTQQYNTTILALEFRFGQKTYIPKHIEYIISQLFYVFIDGEIICLKNRFGSLDEFENINDYIKQCYNYTMSLNKQQNKMVSK